jgi:hypothetical protein
MLWTSCLKPMFATVVVGSILWMNMRVTDFVQIVEHS